MKIPPILRWAVILVGVAAMGAAILAPQLGLDSNQDWGPSRTLLLLAGALIVGLAWIDKLIRGGRFVLEWIGRRVSQSRGAEWVRRSAAALPESRALRGVRRGREGWQALVAKSPFLKSTVGNRRTMVLGAAWAAFLLIVASYAWFASVGMLGDWPATSAYHDMQAEAFLHGQTHLLIEPDPRLLALPNPYDPKARESVPQVWDASLYAGRYYLYWGPVPALLIAPLRAIAGIRVEDNALVFLFMVGMLFWCMRLLTRAWWDHFREVPGWIVVATLLTVGWANPLPWLLNTPFIYESAIAGGQFFLLMGVYALYAHLGPDRGTARNLAWAGISLSLAVGTRSSLAPAVFVLAAIILYRLLRRWTHDGPSQTATAMASFFLPLAIAAAALAAYNEARFDSPFEFGQRYQLTSIDLQNSEAGAFSFANAPPNLYNYLVNPVRLLSVFPYLKPNWGGVGISILRIRSPEGYYARQVAGVVMVSPFLVYSLAAALSLLKRRIPASSALEQPRWLLGTLLSLGAVEFAAILLFSVGSMRYLGDVVPSLLLAAAVWFWQVLASRAGRSFAGAAALGLLLMTWTAVAGLLLGVTSFHSRFELLNPELFDRLTRFFTL